MPFNEIHSALIFYFSVNHFNLKFRHRKSGQSRKMNRFVNVGMKLLNWDCSLLCNSIYFFYILISVVNRELAMIHFFYNSKRTAFIFSLIIFAEIFIALFSFSPTKTFTFALLIPRESFIEYMKFSCKKAIIFCFVILQVSL